MRRLTGVVWAQAWFKLKSRGKGETANGGFFTALTALWPIPRDQ
jgi:hypothetical protein